MQKNTVNTDLSYPLDSQYILRKKRAIKKQLLANERKSSIEKRIAILGGSTTAEIKNILEIFLLNYNIRPIFYESEYNKYYEDALFGNETLNNFKPDLIYIHTSVVNIARFPNPNDSEDAVNHLLNEESRKYRSIWDSLAKFNCAIVQNNFDYPIHRSLGNLDCYDIHGKTAFIQRINAEFAHGAREIKNLYLNDINYLSSYLGLKNWFS